MYITGDLHRSLGLKRLDSTYFHQGNRLTKNDYIIVAGDFGLLWDNSSFEKKLRKWLKERPFTTLFIDGNHENFNLLNSYPVKVWNGGKVHKISDSIIHLMRGQVFTIEDKRIFTFGGADSFDKFRRVENISWWKQEMPSQAEFEEGIYNLEKHNWNVDIVITHDCSTTTFNKIKHYMGFEPDRSRLNEYFDMLEEKLDFKHWLFGHHHNDIVVDDKHTLVYLDFIKV